MRVRLLIALLFVCFVAMLASDVHAQIVRPVATPRGAATLRPTATPGRIPVTVSAPAGTTKTWYDGNLGTFQLINGTMAAVSDGDLVGYWADQSGNGSHIVAPGNNTTRATLQVDEQSSENAIRFDGTNDVLTLAGIQPLSAANGGWTIFAVMKVTDHQASDIPWSVYSDGGGAGELRPAFRTAEADLSVDVSGGRSFNTTNGGFTYATWFVLTLRHTSGTNVEATQVWFDGDEEIVTGSSANVAYSIDATVTLSLGGVLGDATYQQVDIGEFITYASALSDADRIDTLTYLQQKWGTP